MLRSLRLVIVGFYALLALSAPAVAGTILGNERNCVSLANSAIMMGMIKESSPGRSWSGPGGIEPELREAVQEAIGSPNTYISDQEDADLVMRAMYLVWEFGASPDEILEACLRG